MDTIVANRNNTTNKKIFIYEIQCHKRKQEDSIAFPYIQNLFTEISKDHEAFTYNNEKDSRWYGIESVNITNDAIEIVLISCKYLYRPNLIDVQNRSERPSPKNDSEGDKEKTHVLIRNSLVAFEQKRNGTSINVFRRLLNLAWDNLRKTLDPTITSIEFKQLIDCNFLEIIRKANKIKNVKFTVESTLIGSEFFNFSNDEGVEDKYVIELKARKRHTFDKNGLIGKLEKILMESEVNKVTVNLNDEDDNLRIINTDEISRQYNIYVEKNIYGEVDSSDMFKKMRDLI